MQKILDVGCGIAPWLMREEKIGDYSWLIKKRICDNRHGFLPYEKHVGVSKDQFYFCVDIEASAIQEAQKDVEALTKEYTNSLIDGVMIFGKIDGRNLPFSNDSFDVVIFSDVISSPYVCREHIKEILREMVRVMKPDARLIVTAYQTPEVSWHNRGYLETMQELRLESEYQKSEFQGLDECMPVFWDIFELVYLRV